MKNHKIKRYEAIATEYFWEYHFSAKEIENLFKSDDKQKRQFLFEKILLNSPELFQGMELFDKTMLQTLLDDYKVPYFNKEYIGRRKNMLEYYFFNKPLEIDELKWSA